VFALGGYRVQGRSDEGAATLLAHARELADAGAAMLVLELVPAALAARVSAENPQLLTIGIWAGTACAGQVLVLHDMLGITRGKLPRFVRNFMAEAHDVEAAVRLYVAEVKAGRFPHPEHHSY
jgi:3-methyl-2-oxobutanoate hydroxymethyltransferase